jgi:hypothetical protein
MNFEQMAEQNANRAKAAIALADMISANPTDQVFALMTAVTVIIERQVGTAMAGSALMALVEPTLADWAARPEGEAIQ